MSVWIGLGFAGLITWAAASVWLVRRSSRGQEPYVDPYDWQ